MSATASVSCVLAASVSFLEWVAAVRRVVTWAEATAVYDAHPSMVWTGGSMSGWVEATLAHLRRNCCTPPSVSERRRGSFPSTRLVCGDGVAPQFVNHDDDERSPTYDTNS